MTERYLNATEWDEVTGVCIDCGATSTARLPKRMHGFVYGPPTICADCMERRRTSASAHQRALDYAAAEALYARLAPVLSDRDALIAALADYIMEQD